MARERKRDAWRRRLLGPKDRPAAASSQADDSNSVSSTSELAPAVLSPLRANTPDPAPSEQVETLDTQQQEPETPNDVWAAAFRKFQESDGDLAKDYAKVINPAHEENVVKFDVDFVKSTVKKLDKRRDEKQWKVAFAGKSIRIRSQVEKMVKFLIWTDTVVKPALSNQPHAALAWSAVSIFLPLVKAGTELHETLLAGLEEINCMLVFWNAPESTVYSFRSHARRSFYDVFIDLHHHIIRYYAHAVCHLSSAQLSRARENLVGWNGWEAETKSISELNQKCQSYLEAAQRKAFQESMEMQLVEIHNSRLALQDISRSLEEIQFHYEDQLEGRLLESLHADFKGHKNANPERVQGTGEWVFQDERFHQWRDNESSSLLWISAGPGCGKSVLSRALIDANLLRSSSRATTSSVCYFFFKDGDEKRTRACDAVAAILHQLFAQDLTGNLIKKAKAPYHRAGAGLRDSFDELWDIFTSCISSPDAGEIICVLDALDECEQPGRDRLVRDLKRFYDTQHYSPSSSSLKFIITSRPWYDIEASFSAFFETGHSLQSSHINGDESSWDIRREIGLVIEENLPTVAGHLPQIHQEYIAKYMKSMENRTYLWLRLFFQTIKQNPAKYKRKGDIIKLLKGLPSEISEVYEKLLQPSYTDDNTKLLLQIMLAAPRPLSVKEADEALTLLTAKTSQWESKTDFDNDCWGEDFASVVQNCTGFLVVVTENDQELSFLHQTVREFLLGPKPTPNSWKGRFSYPETQTAMLSACLERLSPGYINEEGQNWWYYTRFLGYAAQYWPVHYELQEHDKKEEASGQARLLCDIVQPNTVAWLDHNQAWRRCIEQTKLSTENFDILSIAAFFGLTHLVEKTRQNDAVDSSQVRGNLVAPLQAASWNGQLEMVKALVRNNADIDYDSLGIGSPIECAIRNRNLEIVEFLLTCRPAPAIRQETLELAAQNSSGTQILGLLLQRFPDIEVPEKVLRFAADNQVDGGHVLETLLHKRPALMPSDQTICVAISNSSCGPDALKILLDRRADFQITGEMIEGACYIYSWNAVETLEFLCERNPDAKVTDRALVLAAENEVVGFDILNLFSAKHPGLKIPTEAFHAAATNHGFSVEILRLLFELEDSEQVTPDLILSAMCNPVRGPATLDFLACRDGFSLTNGCFETWFQTLQNWAFYRNLNHGMRMGGDEITVTDTMMKGIVGCRRYIVELFLKSIGGDFSVSVTDDIYNASHEACRSSRHPEMDDYYRYDRCEVMELLVSTESVDVQMKGKDGHPLTRNEAMEKLESWRKELGDFYASDTDSFDDTFE